jgi:D-serine deaminase-like pyridoxal phosphate-dependent protein
VDRLPDLDTVTTPSLVLDAAVLRENIRAMAERAREAGLELRPHSKTHKSIAVAKLQLEHGAAGLTVATAREAECFAAAGVDDLLVAYPPVGQWRLDRLTGLADNARVRVVLDSREAAELLDAACRRAGVRIGYLWEVDCGVGRVGTPPGVLTAELVAPVASSTRHAFFDGLMAFGGHAYAAGDREGIKAAALDERQALLETAEALATLGVETRAMSIGTTPTTHVLMASDGATEIRPGNYVFYDATQVALELVPKERCALSVIATVVARPSATRLILDCGSKALAAERLTDRTSGFGFVIGHEELAVERLYEEHAIVTSASAIDIPIGSRLRVVPNHSCATANLHEQMLVLEGDDVVDVWSIDARGWERRWQAVVP